MNRFLAWLSWRPGPEGAAPSPLPGPVAHPEMLALLAACKRAPTDDLPRLALADWLEERGDEHQQPRAELIRLQCRLSRLSGRDPARPGLQARVGQLRRQHGEAWLGRLAHRRIEWAFRRGLLWGTVAELAGKAPFPDLGGPTACPWVEGLTVVLGRAADRQVRRVAESSWLVGVGSLRLRPCGSWAGVRLSPAAVRALAESPCLAGLARLDLSDADLRADAARALADCPRLAGLGSLCLARNSVGDEGALALAGSPHLAGLTALELPNNAIGDEGGRALADSPHLAGLTCLALQNNRLGDRATRALAGSPHRASLRSLLLQRNRIGADGALALAAAPGLDALAVLRLEGNPLGAEARAALQQRFGRRVRL